MQLHEIIRTKLQNKFYNTDKEKVQFRNLLRLYHHWELLQ